MTAAEADLLKARGKALGIPLTWKTRTDGFLELRTGPCPFVSFTDGQASCQAYDVRPYNCRRFGCFRANAKTEPLELDAHLGSVNLQARWHDKDTRKAAERLQRQAQGWARSHGWTA